MPRSDARARRTELLPAATFVRFGDRLRELQARGTLVPLHIGDSWLDASELLAAAELERAALHRSGPLAGLEALRQAVAARGRTSPDAVVVTPGATGGLTLLMGAICDPGDEVIVLTPSWPLVFGIVASRDGRVIEVPVSA